MDLQLYSGFAYGFGLVKDWDSNPKQDMEALAGVVDMLLRRGQSFSSIASLTASLVILGVFRTQVVHAVIFNRNFILTRRNFIRTRLARANTC